MEENSLDKFEIDTSPDVIGLFPQLSSSKNGTPKTLFLSASSPEKLPPMLGTGMRRKTIRTDSLDSVNPNEELALKQLFVSTVIKLPNEQQQSLLSTLNNMAFSLKVEQIEEKTSPTFHLDPIVDNMTKSISTEFISPKPNTGVKAGKILAAIGKGMLKNPIAVANYDLTGVRLD